MAVRARGSTGCTTSSSSDRLPDVKLEFDRSRLMDQPVGRRYDAAMSHRSLNHRQHLHVSIKIPRLTHCSRPVQHAHTKVPQQ